MHNNHILLQTVQEHMTEYNKKKKSTTFASKEPFLIPFVLLL